MTNAATVERDFEKQWDIISRGTVDLLPEDEFKALIRSSITENRPLRVKQGFDPTAPDIHLGHTVGIRKLRQFQELGHKIVLIVGDYTGMVGDPSGRSATRPQLAYDDIMKNAETYQTQFFRILDRSLTEVRCNGEWFKEMNFHEVMGLAMKFTVARLLERDDFEKRYKQGLPISIHELFYPLMQAYDSVAIKADIEIGGTDQKFNLLAGRTIQQAYGVKPQCVLTLPILTGTDGEQKMSKSLGNYIGIDEPAREIFGKVMSIPDSSIYSYFEMVTDVTLEELAQIKQRLSQPDINPMDIKKELGERLTDMYNSEGSGKKARSEFERIFAKGQLPDDMPEAGLSDLKKWELDPDKLYLVGLIAKAGLAKSNSEARKLITAGAVSLNGEKTTDPKCEFVLAEGETMILKVGKRRYLKLNR
ncbi:MAG: tyrosine--tRNA ligase [candidate division Zixibacteria bacterium]|nr:tyrosine--tRNA ligase [candidate division Zixibacteria bacterium]